MNEHALPEDFSRWPRDPFELLGVPPGVGDRDLRRAYAALIRVYKPEQYPEHFRRIREAYEAARQYSQLYTAFRAPEDSTATPADRHVPATPEADNPDTGGGKRPIPSSRPRSLDEELDEAWSLAVDGDEARAYARLLELQDRYPDRSEVCVRLYGLLDAAPELDARRTPCDFLTQGLRLTGGGPCHELYRRAIEDDPGEALTERFAGLLDATTQPGLLATFVEWRWRAAGRQGRFEVIGNDLPGLRARFAIDQDEIWLRLLASAADQLAWAPVTAKSSGFTECLYETARYGHLQLRCPDVFDRLDYLMRLSVGWRVVRNKGSVPAELLELLSRFWTRPFPEIRRGVTALLTKVAVAADVWLAYLDKVNVTSPPLLSLFGQMLDSYQRTLDQRPDDRESDGLELLARRFLEEHSGLRYPALRPRLLAFCLREMIDPDVIARVALSRTVVLPEGRLDKLVNDWPLRHVYRACTLVWD